MPESGIGDVVSLKTTVEAPNSGRDAAKPMTPHQPAPFAPRFTLPVLNETGGSSCDNNALLALCSILFVHPKTVDGRRINREWEKSFG